MRITISTDGRITLPLELRELDQIRPGQQFTIERNVAL
jgi:bifunctional DNA-binding transcriptional regulator/antitoxin component of YhaV-PrlF toxin-antitoxin module